MLGLERGPGHCAATGTRGTRVQRPGDSTLSLISAIVAVLARLQQVEDEAPHAPLLSPAFRSAPLGHVPIRAWNGTDHTSYTAQASMLNCYIARRIGTPTNSNYQ